jgi:hypothetical protein
MEGTIANLEYTLKDVDVQGQPVIQQMIQDLVTALQKVMVVKKARWAQQESELGGCPCGCENLVARMSS